MVLNIILLGKRIREYRILKRMTQAELAEKVHCSPSYISYVENGSKCVSFEMFVLILDALQISANDLLCESVRESSLEKDKSLTALLLDCTPCERQIVLDLVLCIKRSIRKNCYR